MERTLVITVVGDDRPGIVAGVTKGLFDLGCNLEDVSSSILRGHFTMMLIVHAPEGVSAGDAEGALEGIAEDMGLIVRAGEVADTHEALTPPTHVVSVYGADQPGIIFRVADALASRGVNITDLRSRVLDPASGDDAAYVVMMEVVGPDDLDDQLVDLRAAMDVEVSVNRIEPELL
jgi:glycine cleavage system transcriptional repressor